MAMAMAMAMATPMAMAGHGHASHGRLWPWPAIVLNFFFCAAREKTFRRNLKQLCNRFVSKTFFRASREIFSF